MVRKKIKCHKYGATYKQPHFFILNKGRNSGKPLLRECPNCFVFIAETTDESKYYFNLCYALWVGNVYQKLLIGSVIEFIRIGDLCDIIDKTSALISQENAKYEVLFRGVRELNSLEETLVKQVKLVKLLQRRLINKLLKEG